MSTQAGGVEMKSGLKVSHEAPIWGSALLLGLMDSVTDLHPIRLYTCHPGELIATCFFFFMFSLYGKAPYENDNTMSEVLFFSCVLCTLSIMVTGLAMFFQDNREGRYFVPPLRQKFGEVRASHIPRFALL